MIICTLQNTSVPEFTEFYGELEAGQPVAVLDNETVDEKPENQYYLVALMGGTVYNGMSGRHLAGIELWKNKGVDNSPGPGWKPMTDGWTKEQIERANAVLKNSISI